MNNVYHWSSTQKGSGDSWILSWRGGTLDYDTKYSAFHVRAFAPIGHLTINSTLATKFTLSYTNNYGDVVTEKVSQGGHNLNVKNGTQVTVTPDAIGNITAEPQTFTWQGFTHECNFVFAKDAGVYIQHINGALYTESEWTAGGYANSDANGVAVLSSDASFVIAKENVGIYGYTFGGHDKKLNDIVSTTSKDAALLDFKGYENTSKIIKQLTGYTDNKGITGSPAAEKCVAYIFPNGRVGYLPALGEWKLAYDNKSSVDSSMTLIGGNIAYQNSFWSSTAGSIQTAGHLMWGTGSISSYARNNSTNVRAFTTL